MSHCLSTLIRNRRWAGYEEIELIKSKEGIRMGIRILLFVFAAAIF